MGFSLELGLGHLKVVATQMKLSRHQVIGSLLLALIVLALLVVRAWPPPFSK